MFREPTRSTYQMAPLEVESLRSGMEDWFGFKMTTDKRLAELDCPTVPVGDAVR
ncbi:hypothetical protein V1292_003576 [Bradyrhizobium sp. AZCC 1719]